MTEPELIKEVLNNKDKAFPKPATEGFFKKLLGDGLVTTEGEKWAKQRKLANYAFHGDSLKVQFTCSPRKCYPMLSLITKSGLQYRYE